MAEVIIRLMKWADVPKILEIERVSFSTPWSETAFLKEIYNPYSINRIAVLEDKIAGYICINYLFGEAHILNLAVHPDLRRRGIATALVKKVLDELKERGCKSLFLEVRVTNDAAMLFYERFGFRPVGFRKDYYTYPREDAVLMVLDM